MKIKKDPTVVGPGKYNPLAPQKVVTPSSPVPGLSNIQQPNPKISGTVDKITQKLADQGFTFKESDAEDIKTTGVMDSLSNKQLETVAAMLKSRGYTVKASAQYIKNLFLSETELNTIAGEAKGDYNTLISLLGKDLLPGIAKGAGTAENLPTRSIYKYSDEDVDRFVNEVYQSKLMRPATPAELAEIRKIAKPQLEQGTVSTSKKVKNAVTGKLEVVSTQEAGPTKEAVAKTIEDRLKELNPDDADRADRINFSSWLSQNVAGA